MGNNNRYATSHRLKRRKAEALIERRVNENTRQIVECHLVGIGDESGQDDFIPVRRAGNRLKHFLAFPPLYPGDDQHIFVHDWMRETLERLITLYQSKDVFARLECRERKDESVRQMILILPPQEIHIVTAHYVELFSDPALDDGDLAFRHAILRYQIISGRLRNSDDPVSGQR